MKEKLVDELVKYFMSENQNLKVINLQSHQKVCKNINKITILQVIGS